MVEKAGQCMAYIGTQARRLGITVERKVRNRHRTKAFEAAITEATLKKIDIEHILGDIADSERILAAQSTPANIQILIAQYQQVRLVDALIRLDRRWNITRPWGTTGSGRT